MLAWIASWAAGFRHLCNPFEELRGVIGKFFESVWMPHGPLRGEKVATVNVKAECVRGEGIGDRMDDFRPKYDGLAGSE